MMKLAEKYNINHFKATDGKIKCAIAERFNRTLRTRIYRYLHANNTNKYIDVLGDIIKSYNNSHHRTIRMAPAVVKIENEETVIINIRKTHIKSQPQNNHLSVGDFVRISKDKGVFEKGSTENWSEEVFKVIKTKKTPQGYIYRLEDLDGEDLTSIFYHWEVQKTDKPDLLDIKVLKTRINPKTKKKEFFVRWKGYPEKFNSWIPAENVDKR